MVAAALLLAAASVSLAADGARTVMIHADDAGITHSVNTAIEEAFASGSISSSSIIVPAPWFPEIAAYARSHPQYDFGVHLTLNSEFRYLRWPGVASSGRIPSLLDPQGFLWPKVRDASAHVRAAEAKIEMQAQIERARQFGVPITHLDTHMGTLLSTPELAQVYAELGREYHLPIMTASEYAVKPFMIRAPFPGPRGRVEDFPERYQKAILEGKPGEVTELIVHLGLDCDELRAAVDDGAYGASWRETDYRTFTSPEMHAFLKQHNVRLVGWKQLADLVRSK